VKTLLDHPALLYRSIKKLSIVIGRFEALHPPPSQFRPIDSAIDFYVGLTSVLCHAVDGFQVAGGARATRSLTRPFSFRTGIADGSETFAIAADSDGEESHRSSTALWMSEIHVH
jgi:hypothetical protein